ncbi:DUF1642 domain-containing protein [Lactococcus lactis]|uniref:DUF1642 domain-containing protein n=1 Tax=Lactococcus lactis TaxID=1358 RepID=UPI000559A989|nr:DUF1642 domain-containing protein [Lactococcus lactis]AJA57763.1 hypothetical protein QI18_10415 [Lactococcus lactis subsp. lactis]WBM77119.1 DUF1642 domain-containing protein [Lactococcus lactis]WSP31582.1 DUF1642 domain-containing protein [Lactococcus lactis subsp. lactis]
MTKFEEEFKALTSWDWINIDLIQQILTRFGNWHSDEEFQELFDKYSNLNNNYEKEVIRSSKLESQIVNLKSQLQQQALPVVPEDVAKWIECVKGKNNNALALLDDDNMPDDVNEWLFFQRNDDNINLILRAWLDGFTVEKPQLFYLRDELTGQFLAKDNQFKDKDRYFFWTGADPLTHSVGTAWKLTFTQAEIASMQTGSYEQIEAVK